MSFVHSHCLSKQTVLPWRRSNLSSLIHRPSLAMDASSILPRRERSWVSSKKTGRGSLLLVQNKFVYEFNKVWFESIRTNYFKCASWNLSHPWVTEREFLLTISISSIGVTRIKYQLGDYSLIQYQIPRIYIIAIVWQTVRRITNEIFGVEGLICKGNSRISTIRFAINKHWSSFPPLPPLFSRHYHHLLELTT